MSSCKDGCFVAGGGTEHIGATAFGRLFAVHGCANKPHIAISVGPESQVQREHAFQALWRGNTLRFAADSATEQLIQSAEHHARPEVVFRRQAPGASCCIDPSCDLSGGFAHVGPCEACSCPMRHAIDECPMRPGCYERTYRLLYGTSGTQLQVVRAQIEMVEHAHPGVRWTISKTYWCAVAWFHGEPVGFVMGCMDKTKSVVELLNAINEDGVG